MQALISDLGSWMWRLVPANPILVRVVNAGGRRLQHLYIRLGYLLVLTGIVSFGVIFAQSTGTGSPSLADLAKSATGVFQWVSFFQLLMVCILAPVFTAAAITQEKGAQTFNILLSTPLTNGQIVMGSLLSRLYFVFVLLVAGIPLFCIMMVYGGVTGDKIFLSIALAGCTAALTGSLAIAISVIRVGTGRTIFSFYLAIALYLAATYSLAPALIPPEAAPAPGETARMSWLAAFNPFLSLWVVLGKTPAPDLGMVAHYGWPLNYSLAYPETSYIVMTLCASLLLVVASLSFVRRGAREGEPTLLNRLFSRESDSGPVAGAERTRQPRHVGRNPVAWREATAGAAGGGAVARYSMLGLGFLVGIVILFYYGRDSMTQGAARQWLFGIVGVELGITLFVATATAATSMTREKESNTLGLLLTTPITSGQIIWGKIKGLIWFSTPMLAVPYTTVVLFVLVDLMKGRRGTLSVVNLESLITIPLLFLAFTAVACMVGLWRSIDCKKTLLAVFQSGAILILAIGALSGCANLVVSSSEEVAAAIMPFTPYYALFVAIDPAQALTEGGAPLTGHELATCRTVAFIASLVAAVIYSAIGYGLHTHMVRSFDMTIRKQTA